MSLWTHTDADVATGGTSTAPWSCDGISIDTRTIEPGDLFVALKAARDGHDFVAAAFRAGAAAALVTHRPDDVAKDAPLLVVDDVLSALEDLGRAGRARADARVVAVTGSVGKTSTKEMLREMLGAQGRAHASVASYNNHWGVPLTLARMPQDTEYSVIEIGMNHPGEIAPLARMARPHVAMVTTVAAVHLEAFESVAGIAQEKAAIFEGLEPDGVAVLNADVETAQILEDTAKSHGARLERFGHEGREWVLDEVVVSGEATVARARAHGVPLLFKLGSPGAHFAMNGLGALAAVEALGGDLAIAAADLGRWSPYQGRGVREVVALDADDPTRTLVLLDDAYNANPTSMGAALDVLAAAEPQQQGRRVAYVGDMKELGPDEAMMHAEMADHPAIALVDTVHCIGPLMAELHKALPHEKRGRWAETSAELVPYISDDLGVGDVVMAKGSLSMGLKQIVDGIRKLGHAASKSDKNIKNRDA